MATVWRVRDRSSFTALRREGRRRRSGPLTVTWLPGTPGTPPRVAYAVGRPVGTAVVRNRVRRRLRAAVATLAPELPPGTYLIGAAPAAAHLSVDQMRTNVSTALASLQRPSPSEVGS